MPSIAKGLIVIAVPMGSIVDVNGIVSEAVRRAVQDQGEVGVQVAAHLGGRLIVDVWGGQSDESTGAPVANDTIFNIFSVTKAITAVALHIMVERGYLEYSAPISEYWPEFAAKGKGSATVLDALSHRTGIPQMPAGSTPECLGDWKWMVSEIAELEPMFRPGTRSAYHGYTFGWIVGELVCRTDPSTRPFGRFVQEEICDPLGLNSCWLGIPDDVIPRVATLRDDTSRLNVDVEVSSLPAPARVAQLAIPPAIRTTPQIFSRRDVRQACFPGAGAIADARSISRLFAVLANRGALDGVRLLSESRVRSFLLPRPKIPGDEFDLDDKIVGNGGFHLPVRAGVASYYHAIGRNGQRLAHAGSGGQMGWAELDTTLSVSILHNRMFSPHTDELGDPLVAIGKAVRRAAAIAQE